MNGLKKLHDEQDDFIKKTLQADKIVNQPMFDTYEQKMDQTKIKVKRYSYKHQRIIKLLLFLLAISVGFNVYLVVVKHEPIMITNIFETVKNETKDEDKLPSEPTLQVDESKNEENDSETKIPEENSNPEQEDDKFKENPNDSIAVEIPEKEPEPPTITPELFTEVNTNEVEDFVEQFAIGINKFQLSNTSDLESNTILLYIAQQYFSAKSNTSDSLTVDSTYASSAKNFHKFLGEFTINDYSTIEYLKSYTNYIGYNSRSKSYVNGTDYSIISKEKYTCEDVSITNKNDNVYTAKAKVNRDYEGEKSTYEITFTFKVNSNYKYQKFKLLSLNKKLTSGSLENVIHLVEN